MIGYRSRALPIDDDPEGSRLILAQQVLRNVEFHLELRKQGANHENAMYLLGRRVEEDAVALALVRPILVTTPRSYATSVESHQDVLKYISGSGLEIIGQIHCHPGEGVYHSDGDDDLAFGRSEGYWSMVVPHYSRAGLWTVADCGFHHYTAGCFKMLTNEAVARRILIIGDYEDRNNE